jgi:hypothetical protein
MDLFDERYLEAVQKAKATGLEFPFSHKEYRFRKCA